MIRVISFVIVCFMAIFPVACDVIMGSIISKAEEIDNRGVKGGLVIDQTGHYLQYKDGNAFFWLGDTGWELFHRLKKEEIENYLENRRQKGFNIIQAVILAEFDGLRKPNQYGEVPLKSLDPTKPNEKYFELVDWTIKLAKEKDMFIGLLPTWGDKVAKMWGEGPVIFDQSNAYIYGYFLGKRYKYFRNIIWILGGDRPPVTDSADWRPKWRAMAKGIRDGTGHDEALFTYHISGGEHSTSYNLHNEEWLHINTMQSGHGSGHDVPVWNWIERDRKLFPVKPTIDLEPNYEDHPVNPWPKWDTANGYFNDYDVRKQTYRSVFAGACGVTYGHHSVWQFWSAKEEKINHADRYWTEAIDRPGAFQVGYLKKLIESRSVTDRIPDQSIIKSGQGEKAEYATAFRDKDNRYCMVYLPTPRKIDLDLSFIPAKEIRRWWFNPRTGESGSPTVEKKEGIMSFDIINGKKNDDWVLVIDDASKEFLAPGKIK